MVDIRGFNGGLNIDAAEELLPPGDYSYAFNVNKGDEGITKLLGTTALANLTATPSGTNWVCGSHFDKTRQKVFYFIFNSAGYHRIVSVNTANNVSTILFEDRTNTGGTSIFGWSNGETAINPLKLIKDIKIIYRDNGQDGDLVYFIDPLKRPLKFNTVKLPVLASTNDVILDYFKVIKAPPSKQPICSYFDAPGRNVNNLRKKLFQFKSRFVYEDDEKSVWSAISKVPLPPRYNDDAYYADGTKSNSISIAVPSGSKIVKKIEIAARVNIDSVCSNFFLVDTICKSLLSIDNNSTYSYIFFNDGAYLPIETEESNLLFDYVPDEANTLELANGNTLIYAGIKEGRDRITNFDVTATTIQSALVPTGDITFVTNPESYTVLPGSSPVEYYTDSYSVEITGIVRQGDAISFSWGMIQSFDGFNTYNTLPEPTFSYTVTSGQTTIDAVNAFITQLNSTSSNVDAVLSAQVGNTYVVRFSTTDSTKAFYADIFFPESGVNPVYIPNTSSGTGDTDSIASFKWLGRYKYGISYYDSDGKTNGVFIGNNKNLTVDIPQYSESSGVPQSSSVQLSINHAPPSWARYYHIVRTKEITSSFSKFLITKGVDATETSLTVPYVYINIQNITKHIQDFPSSATIVNYTESSFVKGDRIRFIKNYSNGTVFSTQNDYEILGLVKRGTAPNDDLYVKLSFVSGMPSFANVSGNQPQFLVEILRPSQIISDEESNFYYEIGERYDIVTDINSNSVHQGSSQNQIIGAGVQPCIIRMYDGDYYGRQRSLTSTTATPIVKYVCMDSHFSDFWESAVWGQGRALVIDESAKTQYFPALIRFSQSFIQGTNINNLNRFYPENFEEADNSFGDILRLKTRENFIRIFQRYKVGMMPIYRSIIVDNATSSQVAISEKLLNKPNYYAGEYGIDKYGSSLVSTDYGDYFLDTINRAIIRVSLDGMTNISDTYNVASFTNNNLDENSYGYGFFNYERRSVVILMSNVSGSNKKIMSYSESRKQFESEHGYTDATSFQFVNGFLWSFYVKPYIHNDQNQRNNFYGVQQGCSIQTVFNGQVALKKTYTAIEMLSTELWNVLIQTGPILIKQSTLDSSDFSKSIPGLTIQNKESKYNATIKRDELSSGGKFFGESMKGCYAKVTFANNTSQESRLISVSLKYIQSPLTNT